MDDLCVTCKSELDWYRGCPNECVIQTDSDKHQDWGFTEIFIREVELEGHFYQVYGYTKNTSAPIFYDYYRIWCGSDCLTEDNLYVVEPTDEWILEDANNYYDYED